MIETIVFDPNKSADPYVTRLANGAAVEFHVDCNYWAVREGGALSTAVWTVNGGASIGSGAKANNIATSLATITSQGIALFKVVLTLDSSGGDQIGILYIRNLAPVIDTRGITY